MIENIKKFRWFENAMGKEEGKKARKFNIEFSKRDPFYLNEKKLMNTNMNELTWDWYFEKNAYYTKKQTIENFNDMIEIIVENRSISEQISGTCIIDILVIGIKANPILLNFYISLFGRMIKTSKVIQDLSIQGNYIEAKSLLRNNFERDVLIQYFTKNIERLGEYLNAKKGIEKSNLGKYKIKNLVKELEKDYRHYEVLCYFSHANLYEEDLSMFEGLPGHTWAMINNYNNFQENSFIEISFFNNNLILESLKTIYDYILKYVPEGKDFENFRKILDKYKETKIISLKSKKQLNKHRWFSI